MQTILGPHAKAIYALVAAYAIYQTVTVLSALFLARFGPGGLLLGSVLGAAVAVGLGASIIHLLFERFAAGHRSDIALSKRGRNVVGRALDLIAIALGGYVLYRIIGVVLDVLSAITAWKGEPMTALVGVYGVFAISVFVGIFSLLLWMAVLNSVFGRLGAKPD
jgi:hypothetical protein